MFLRDAPLSRKLMAAFLLTSGTVLLLSCASFIAYEVVTLRKNILAGYSTRAQIIAANSSAALAFQNEADATDVLGALRSDKRIVAACLYDGKGKVFARYPAGAPDGLFPPGPGETGYRPGWVDIFSPVFQGGQQLGTVYLRSDLSSLTERYSAYALLSAAIVLGSILVAYLLARALQGQIARPVLSLARTARAITSGGDFSVRAEKFGEDELGSLTDAFNKMLSEIQAREKALIEKTKLLDLVMGSMSEGVVVADREGKMIYFNKSAEEIVGLGRSDSHFSQWTDEFGVFRGDRVTPFPPEESPLVKAIQGQAVDGVVQFVRNPNKPRGVFVSLNGRPLLDERGKVDGGLVVFRDMTLQLKAEADLRASEANYREIFEKINDALYIHDPATGAILDVNQRVSDLIGYSREEVLSSDQALFITGNPGYRLEDAAEWMRKAAQGEPQLFEWQARHKDGSARWVEVNLKKTVIAGQDRLLALVRDISERKRLEEALKNRDFVSSVLENVPNMIFVKDAEDLRFVMFNRAGEELLGMPRADLIGKNDHDFFPKKDADFFTEKDRKTLASGRLLEIPEETIQTKDKGARVLRTKKIPVMGPEGKPRYLLGISEDITEEKMRHEREVYTKALEVSNREMQDFVFVASHDLQEPLRKIQSFGEFLKDEFQETLGETGKGYIERMGSAAQRMQVLINDLLALTRVTTKAQPFVPVDLGEVLAGVLGDLETRVRETEAKVESEGLPVLAADPTQMRQVFQNLIGNALKFRRPGERPLIRITAKEVLEQGQGRKCRIRFSDNGIGFDNKYSDLIFKVFERLHGRGEYEGTGIGLAICRKVVERHGGSISAEGAPGKGAVFTVVLPMEQNKGG